MKHTITILLLLFCACTPTTGGANPTPSPQPPGPHPVDPAPTLTSPIPQSVTWERQYDNYRNADMAWDVVETPEGNSIVVGITGPTPCQLGCNWDGWVIKIDAQGNTLWTRQFGGRGADLLTSVLLDGNDYVATGSKYVFPQARQAWLFKIAPSGHLVWEKTLGGDQDDSGAETIAVPEGGFLMTGQTKSFGVGDGKSDVWLVRLDANANTIWTKTYDLGSEDMGTWIAPFQRDQFIITAVICTDNCGGLWQQGYASYLVIDPAGEIVKSETFAEGPKNIIHKIRPTGDGGAVMVGTTSMSEKFPSADTWIVKLDPQANVAWMKILSSYGRYDGGFDVVQTPDSGYVVVGYSQVYQTPEMNFDNFCMWRLDSNGEVLGTRWWGGPNNDDAYAAVLTSGGALLAGFRDAVSWPITEIPGPADFYVIKTTITNLTTFLPCAFVAH